MPARKKRLTKKEVLELIAQVRSETNITDEILLSFAEKINGGPFLSPKAKKPKAMTLAAAKKAVLSNFGCKTITELRKNKNFTMSMTGAKKRRGNNFQLHGHHLFDKVNRPDLADLIDNILVVEGSIHSEFHSWNKGSEESSPKDFLDFLSDVRGDLFDSDNARTAERHSKLVARLVSLQNNYEGNHLIYN